MRHRAPLVCNLRFQAPVRTSLPLLAPVQNQCIRREKRCDRPSPTVYRAPVPRTIVYKVRFSRWQLFMITATTIFRPRIWIPYFPSFNPDSTYEEKPTPSEASLCLTEWQKVAVIPGPSSICTHVKSSMDPPRSRCHAHWAPALGGLIPYQDDLQKLPVLIELPDKCGIRPFRLRYAQSSTPTAHFVLYIRRASLRHKDYGNALLAGRGGLV